MKEATTILTRADLCSEASGLQVQCSQFFFALFSLWSSAFSSMKLTDVLVSQGRSATLLLSLMEGAIFLPYTPFGQIHSLQRNQINPFLALTYF